MNTLKKEASTLRIKSPTLIGLNLVLILAILAMACNLSGTATPPAPTQGEAPPIEPTPAEAIPTEAISAQDTPSTIVPTEESPASYTPDDRLAFAGFKASPVQVQNYAPGMDIAPTWESIYNPFLLSDEQITALQQNGFVVSPGNELEFFTVYERRATATNPFLSLAMPCCTHTTCSSTRCCAPLKLSSSFPC